VSTSLLTLKRGLRSAAYLICAITLITFTGLVLYSVILRYFFSAPPMWGEELPKLLFVWLSFVGAGFAYLMGANIRMTTLIEKVPHQPRRAIEFAMHLAIVAMLLTILWYSVPILRLTSSGRSIATGLPDMITYLALPIGAVLLLINEFYRLYRIARGEVDSHTSDIEEHI
jgi:TRAP-type transport system small permease protein